MNPQSIFLAACITIMVVACKSESKESTSATTVDTTMVAQPVTEVSLDSTALAEENMKTAPAPETKTSAKDKSATNSKPATTDKTKAPLAAAGESTASKMEADKGYVEFPSKRATYPGGEAALNKYLADNIKYPPMARDNHVEGTVYASILVDEHGNIVDVSFPKPIGSGLEDEVLRVIKTMPALIPAEDHSKPVKTKYMLPVKFHLK